MLSVVSKDEAHLGKSTFEVDIMESDLHADLFSFVQEKQPHLTTSEGK
jgi:hypothetical protein